MVRQLTVFANEVTRVALEVGTQGILGGQARVEGVEGVWDDLTTNVNVSPGRKDELIVRKWLGISRTKCERSLKWYVRRYDVEDKTLTLQTKSVARGDLTRTVDADAQGEILDLKITVNDMVSIGLETCRIFWLIARLPNSLSSLPRSPECPLRSEPKGSWVDKQQSRMSRGHG